MGAGQRWGRTAQHRGMARSHHRLPPTNTGSIGETSVPPFPAGGRRSARAGSGTRQLRSAPRQPLQRPFRPHLLPQSPRQALIRPSTRLCSRNPSRTVPLRDSRVPPPPSPSSCFQRLRRRAAAAAPVRNTSLDITTETSEYGTILPKEQSAGWGSVKPPHGGGTAQAGGQ